MRNSEVGRSGRNVHVRGVYVLAFATECAYEWSSFIELSVSIYDLLTYNKLHTFSPTPRVNNKGSEEEMGKDI